MISENISKVGVVLLNWNGWRDTIECINSVQKLEYKNIAVIVVDNGSTDESLSELRKIPNIVLLPTGANLGFAAGCNVGIDFALQNGCQYIWLLNNDTVVAGDALLPMIQEFEKESHVGVVGSIVYDMQTRKIQFCGGGYINFLLGTSKNIDDLKTLHKLNYISGASMLIARDVIEKVGRLDDSFFLYWEDTEYSFRIAQAGYSLAVALESEIYHKESASSNKVPTTKAQYFTEGAVLFFRKQKKILSAYFGCFLRLAKRALLMDFVSVRGQIAGIINALRGHN